jgi:hypothetical protein
VAIVVFSDLVDSTALLARLGDVGALVASRDGVGLGKARAYTPKGVPAPVQAGILRWRELATATQRTGDLTTARVTGG